MSDDTSTTSTGASYDSETGEVHDEGDGAPRSKRRAPLTPEAQAVLDQRKQDRAWMRRALEALSPALVVEGDPSLRELGSALTDVSRAREVAPLLRLPRVSGRGGPGSALVVSARDYDGASGGEPGTYVLLCVEFHDGAAHKCRTRGVAVRRDDLRPLARALTKYADELDAKGSS
jgi:hypothetical protein